VPGELRKRDTGMSATAETARRRRRREAPIFASSLGNAPELYEILVYGYFAVVIAKVFFPTADQTVSLLVTLGSFGISFLARPVGAIFLGAYGDRKGRKNALTLSILLMIIGTGLMTIMPSYNAVGIAAPILVLCARPLQGFSVGGEFASSTAFLVEHRPDRAGFFGSWQWSSQGLAGLIATGRHRDGTELQHLGAAVRRLRATDRPVADPAHRVEAVAELLPDRDCAGESCGADRAANAAEGVARRGSRRAYDAWRNDFSFSPSRIASARAIENARVVAEKAFGLSGNM
jgi:hypothetical protein